MGCSTPVHLPHFVASCSSLVLISLAGEKEDTVTLTGTLPEAALLNALQRKGLLDASTTVERNTGRHCFSLICSIEAVLTTILVAETGDTIAVTETIPEAALLRVLQQRGLLDTPAGRSHPPAHDDEDTIAVTETLPNAALLSAMQQQGLFDVSSSRHSTQSGTFRPLFHTRFLLIISL
jgi:hypothetical protein